MAIADPSLDDLRRHADQLGFGLTANELEDHRSIILPYMNLYRALDQLEETVLTPRQERAAAKYPSGNENPFNAWVAKTDIRGRGAGPLSGRTVVMNDNICVAGAPFTNGTGELEGFLCQSDATVVTRVLAAGAVIVGKARCEYQSISGGSHTSHGGPVRNPHRPSHSAGGSSSGCGVLVATGEADMAIGGDQGGSVRVPASFCGIVGMKPTHGLVPYTGILGVDPTFDHAGPMTATVADNALLLSVIAGADGLDPRQYAPTVNDYLSGLEDGVVGLRIGVVTEGFGMPFSEADVDASVRAVLDVLVKLGAVVEDVSIPAQLQVPAVILPITAEGAMRSKRDSSGFGTLPRGFYPIDLLDRLSAARATSTAVPATVKIMSLLGQHMHTHHHGRFYAKAQNLLHRITAAYDAVLSRYDLLVMPTVPTKATPLPPLDAPVGLIVQRAFEPLVNTSAFNATGHPAISVPCGMSDGLPIGLMMVGRHFGEAIIYRAARALEKSLALDLRPGRAHPEDRTT